MNRIEKLLQKFCPDGVEFKALGEVWIKAEKSKFGVNQIKQILTTQENGYKCFTSGIKSYFVSQFLVNGEYIFMNDGGFADIKYYDGKAFYTDHTFCFTTTQINVKFLYYFLKMNQNLINSIYFQGTGLKNLNKNKIATFKIPLPPLEIQKEIVLILDAFTELQAELQARQKQYEHYRERLLSFDELVSRSGGGGFVKMMSLGEVCQCFAGGTPKTDRVEFWDNGTISWMSSGEVNKGTIYETEKKITQLGFDKSSTKMIPPNAVVLALAGQGKTRGMVARTKISLCTNQSLCAIVPNETINYSFLYFYLKNQYMQLRQISAGDGTRGGLNLKMVENFQIPIPPLKVQNEVVEILDKFDALVNDISQGLPAEITARKKQYEHYREKLLSFKEKA